MTNLEKGLLVVAAILCVVCLSALRVSPHDVEKCVENSNMSEETCLKELMR